MPIGGAARLRHPVRLVLVPVMLLASLGLASGSAAAGQVGSLAFSPTSVQVDNGGSFTLKIVSTASVPLSGISASIVFDQSIVQVTSVERAAAWADALIWIGADDAAIAAGNQKGKMKGVSAAYINPPANVPAGDQDFINVTFQATKCGTAAISIAVAPLTAQTTAVESQMVDGQEATYGEQLDMKTSGATVTVCGPGVAPPVANAVDGASPGPTTSASPNATASPSRPAGSAKPAAGGATTTTTTGGSQGGDASTAAFTTEQSSWLTFALATLAVAAAGLAALILVLTIIAIAAAVIGAVVLFRVWRRRAEASRVPAPVAGPTRAAAPATSLAATALGDRPRTAAGSMAPASSGE